MGTNVDEYKRIIAEVASKVADKMTTEEPAPPESSGEIYGIKGLLYGDEKIGKTTTILRTIINSALWLTADSTYTVMDTDEFRGKVTRIPWNRLSQLKSIPPKFTAGEYSFDTVALDPTSEALGDALERFVDKYALGLQRARNLPEYGHFYMVMREAGTMAELMREIPANVWYICHTKEEGKIQPNLNPAALKKLSRQCNLIAYLYRETDLRLMVQTIGTKAVKAGSQIPGIPQAIMPVEEFIEHVRKWTLMQRGIQNA